MEQFGRVGGSYLDRQDEGWDKVGQARQAGSDPNRYDDMPRLVTAVVGAIHWHITSGSQCITCVASKNSTANRLTELSRRRLAQPDCRNVESLQNQAKSCSVPFQLVT